MTELIINSSNNENNKTKEKSISTNNNNLLEIETNNQETDLNKDLLNSKKTFKEYNYNPDPFISLSVNKNKNSTLSKSDKIILEYNQIKTGFNKIISSFNNLKPKNFKTQEKYIKKLSEYNITLLNYLGELSTLLNKIIDNPKLYASKKILNSNEYNQKSRFIFSNNNNNQLIIENSEKLITLYQKQYNKITERLTKVKSDEYINKLNSSISNINEEISKYEKENIELKKAQIIFENSLKNKNSGKSSQLIDNNLQIKLDICNKIENEYLKTSKKIENNKEEIQNNSEKINILNQKCQNLKKMAKDMYDIEQFDTVEKIKKKSKEKKEKIQRKIREYEINIHSMKANLNKLINKFQENKRIIDIMEQEKNMLIENYNKKQNEFELVQNKLNDYKNIDINLKENRFKERDTINSRNIYENMKNKKMNIKTEESLKENHLKIENKNKKSEKNSQELISSGPSLISLKKEKSNFGDVNDIQLLNQSEKNEQEDINKDSNKKQINTINRDIINIIGGKIVSQEKDDNNQDDLNEINKELNKGKTNNKQLNLNIKNSKTLSKEMILKGLDKQEKEDNKLIYSSRNIQNKNGGGNFDRRKFLKLNFSFVTPSKDNRLNRSLNTLPNEHNKLNYEIEEDIVLDSNSVNNININTKEKKFNTKIEDVNISQGQNDNLKNNNNNSIEIDKELINKDNEKENTDKIEENYDKDNDKRENALNTILYNVVDNKSKIDKFLESDKMNNNNNNVNNNLNNDEELINKSLEEEHVFEKKKENENEKDENKDNINNKEKGETDSVNYDFDDGDIIIDIDYDKI